MGGHDTAVRQPAHAGTFYPASPEALGRLVDAQLADPQRATPVEPLRQGGHDPGPATATSRRPAGLVVPHAGLVYSGRVAAAAWETLRENPPDVIVIAGTNHYEAGLSGIAVWPDGAWQTPIGDVPVDADLAASIAALGEPFLALPDAHRREHSIEVQLPFIARACPGTPIVPLLVSFGWARAGIGAGTVLGRLLAARRAEGLDVVLAASTDFAHYPSATDAEAVTRTLLPPLLDVDGDALGRLEDALRQSDIQGLACGMCGIEPAVFALAALRAMGVDRGALLAAATSADVPGGDPWRTVGYAAVAFDPPEEPAGNRADR